jgi:hypothetical protein
VTTQGPGSESAPDEPHGTPSVPEGVWLKFLSDSEFAIRASAPRELSARERGIGAIPQPLDDAMPVRRTGGSHDEPTDSGPAAVGDLWQSEDPWTAPAWRDLDGRARLRRACRVITTAAAIALALGAWSCLSTSGPASDGPGVTTVRQLEEASQGPPTAAPFPRGSGFADPFSSAPQAG